MNAFLRIDLLEVPYAVLFLFLEVGLCGFLVGFLGSCELQVMVRGLRVLRGKTNGEEKMGKVERAIVFFSGKGGITNNSRVFSVLSYFVVEIKLYRY